jgi:recombination protein RecA
MARLLEIQKHVASTVKDAELMLMTGEIKKIPVISSGSLAVDVALGVGGYPQGRVVEVFGPESSGKTTLTLHAIAEAQKLGGIAAFIDVEHALDLKYAANLGVNTKELLLLQPDFGEQAIDTVDHMTEKLRPNDIVVVDSVAALTTKAEIEGDAGDHHMAQTARLMSQALKKLVQKVAKSGCVLYFTNQIRDTIGNQGYGPTTDTPGGRALKFYASQRLSIKRVGTTMTASTDGKTQVAIANKVVVKIVKNKTAPPFAEVNTTIRFGVGVSKLDEVLDYGVAYKTIEQNGSYFKFKGKSIGQGRENAIDWLRENPAEICEIELDIRKGLGL